MKPELVNLLFTSRRIDYGKSYFVIIPDIAGGRKNRYNVWNISTDNSVKPSLVGRELSKKIASELAKSLSR